MEDRPEGGSNFTLFQKLPGQIPIQCGTVSPYCVSGCRIGSVSLDRAIQDQVHAPVEAPSARKACFVDPILQEGSWDPEQWPQSCDGEPEVVVLHGNQGRILAEPPRLLERAASQEDGRGHNGIGTEQRGQIEVRHLAIPSELAPTCAPKKAGLAADQEGPRVGLPSRPLPFELVRHPDIVGIQEGQPLGTARPHTEIACRCGSPVGLAQVLHVVASLLADFAGTLAGRSIIDDEDLLWQACLTQHAVEGLTQMGLRTPGWDDDSDGQWPRHFLRIRLRRSWTNSL